MPLWIGAPSTGGLALPSAQPSASTLYGPRGVYLDDEYLIVADTGNHRVMIWHGVPKSDHAPADIVLGQPDFATEGPNARGAGASKGLHMPTAVSIVDGNLIVADSWNHRILRWHGVPQSNHEAPQEVLGQDGFECVETNRGCPRDGASFYWPFGFLAHNGKFYVTDTGNRRVLGWHGDPFGRPADFVLGQPDFASGDENRGGPASASSLRWPHAAAVFEDRLFVADAGNHRVLSWPADVDRDTPAAGVLGQSDFVSNQEFVMARQSAETMRFPYGVVAGASSLSCPGGWMAVADTANNRVLGWNSPSQHAADWVLGQPDFKSNGENHWKAVTHETMCWPYGLAAHGRLLAVADSGNNRVIVWRVPIPERPGIEKEESLCV